MTFNVWLTATVFDIPSFSFREAFGVKGSLIKA